MSKTEIKTEEVVGVQAVKPAKTEVETKPVEKVTETKAKPAETKLSLKSKKFAVILLRGLININPSIKANIRMLGLERKHVCRVIDNNPSNEGMLVKAKDYVTWGEITLEIMKELEDKRGEEGKKHFRLHPPRGGFERKGIKKSFQRGGALGYRGEKINDLLRKML